MFKDGKILIQQKFENEKVRNKRQIAALAFGFGITTEYFFQKVLSKFQGNSHTVSTAHLEQTVKKLMCSIIYEREFQTVIVNEEKARVLVQNYFDSIKTEVDELYTGSPRGTHLENIYREYCEQINQEFQCTELIQYGKKLVSLIDYGFDNTTDKIFKIHVEITVPHLFTNIGKYFEIIPVFIPVFETKKFKKPVTEGNIIILNTGQIFYNKYCVGNIDTIFICYREHDFFTVLHKNYNITYTERKTEKNCIINNLATAVVISNKIPVSLTEVNNSSLHTNILSNGIHYVAKRNYIISCLAENTKIFASKFIQNNITITLQNDPISIFQNSLLVISEFSSDYKGYPKWNEILTTILAVYVVLSSFYIIFQKYSNNRIIADNKEIEIELCSIKSHNLE